MTRDQERARELISLIEGTNLEVEEGPYAITITSETGQRYTVDREGHWRCNNGKRGDTTDLEMEVDDPMVGAVNPLDAPDHNEGVVGALRGHLTDFDYDRYSEFAAEAKRVQDDCDYYRQREAA